MYPAVPDYEVSNLGRVRRVTPSRGTSVGKILKTPPDRAGYLVVNLGGRKRKLHHVVLESFVGPRPRGCEARHLDDDRRNNALTNLAWGSHGENYSDRVRNGGGNHGSRHGMAKLTEEAVMEIRRSYVPKVVTYKALAERYGVCAYTVLNVVRRKGWRHV